MENSGNTVPSPDYPPQLRVLPRVDIGSQTTDKAGQNEVRESQIDRLTGIRSELNGLLAAEYADVFGLTEEEMIAVREQLDADDLS